MSNRFQVEEILSEARRLKGGKYGHVYLSSDRTPEEREQRRKTVNELKQKRSDFPSTRWTIVKGCVVETRSESESNTK